MNRPTRSVAGAVLAWVVRLPANTMVFLVRGYQVCISPLLGKNCRFQPSCSAYFIESVNKYGAIRGAFKGAVRICKCHPFHPGGYDPP